MLKLAAKSVSEVIIDKYAKLGTELDSSDEVYGAGSGTACTEEIKLIAPCFYSS